MLGELPGFPFSPNFSAFCFEEELIIISPSQYVIEPLRGGREKGVVLSLYIYNQARFRVSLRFNPNASCGWGTPWCFSRDSLPPYATSFAAPLSRFAVRSSRLRCRVLLALHYGRICRWLLKQPGSKSLGLVPQVFCYMNREDNPFFISTNS